MAFRFRREGDRIKHKVHVERMGIQPWIEDFKWRVVDWHYNFYMGPRARSAIMSNQRAARRVQDVFDRRSHGFIQRMPLVDAKEARYTPDRTKHFSWTTSIPQVTPYQRNSNPFCPVTPNRTGWREYVEQYEVRGAVRPKSPKANQHRIQFTPDPKPKGHKHVVSGTDDTVPVFPSQD
mmetsp:Transcript_13599/g.23690  ORF Transcript_13599/g.23690 Transcript_13599/m.23690 type:complete len:178 (-) Transcript_13599:69-602(-)